MTLPEAAPGCAHFIASGNNRRFNASFPLIGPKDDRRPKRGTTLADHDRIDLYDSHAHLISDDHARYPQSPVPYGPNRPTRFAGGGVAGRPGGQHGATPVNEKPTAEQLTQWMAEEGVVAAAAVQKARLYNTDNRYILDAADLFADRMRAIVVVDPNAPDTPDKMRDYAKRDIIGVRFFGAGVEDRSNWLNSPASLAAWTLANDLGLLVDIEAPVVNGTALLPAVEQAADRFPHLRIVLDHIFLPETTEPDYGIGAKFEGVAKHPNISVKFTSINMDASREFGADPAKVLRRAVDFFGADKVMWGSDIGTSSGTYKEMVARALEAAKLLTDVERRKFLHDTGRRVLTGWKG
jgi:predicted TIM-barrel fold metal-dependent hydrolase